jgi:hypothetical protein
MSVDLRPILGSVQLSARPDVSTRQAVVHWHPASAVVRRSKDIAAKLGSCKNLAAEIDRQRANISLDHIMVDLNPALPVFFRPKHSTKSAPKNVISGVGCEATFAQRRKFIIHLLLSWPPSIDRTIPMPYLPANNLLLALIAMALTVSRY